MPTLQVRGEPIPLTTFGDPDARPLVFLHGYARQPLDYRLALEEVARRGWRISAPFLFANHGLRRPPTSFWACAALGRRAYEALLNAGVVTPGTPVLGHSTGAAVALSLGAAPNPPARILAVNPVQPSQRHSASFVLSSGWMNGKLAVGTAGDGRLGRRVLRESGLRFYVNWLRAPCRGLGLIEGLRGYTYPGLLRWFGGVPNEVTHVRVLYGDGDEFYPSFDGLEVGVSGVFAEVEVRRLVGENSHEWLMIRPVRLADQVDEFFGA
jgi:pimeloyl-ACP methyl ester carboxylesterase